MKIISLALLLSFSTAHSENRAMKTITVHPVTLKEVVKVYPTPDNQGSLTIHSASEAKLTFYLFDLEGTLIYQSLISKNEKQIISGLSKGIYLYNAFKNDENLKGGKIELK